MNKIAGWDAEVRFFDYGITVCNSGRLFSDTGFFVEYDLNFAISGREYQGLVFYL